MRPGKLCLAAAAWLSMATSAVAVPVYVSPRLDLGPVPANTTVVAFSFDVRKLFPPVETRFEQWRPKPPRSNVKQVPLLPVWKDYHMIHAKQLVDFREAFRRAHQGEDKVIEHLMPRFEEVYKKYGHAPPEISHTDTLARENPRQSWCRKVTGDLNAILTSYNEHGLAGAAAPGETYPQLLARWRSQRNEALRIAARKEGAHESIFFMEGETTDGGQVFFDLPPGTWYIACKSEGKSWYKPVRIDTRGGLVVLTAREATNDAYDLDAWMGQ